MCRYMNDVNGHQERSDNKMHVSLDHKHHYHDSSYTELSIVLDAGNL